MLGLWGLNLPMLAESSNLISICEGISGWWPVVCDRGQDLITDSQTWGSSLQPTDSERALLLESLATAVWWLPLHTATVVTKAGTLGRERLGPSFGLRPPTMPVSRQALL